MSKRKGFFESRNPVLTEKAFAKEAVHTPAGSGAGLIRGEGTMTVAGAVNKSFILGLLLLAGALVGFAYPSSLLMWGSAIAGLVVVIIASFNMKLSPVLAPIYGLLEGVFVGSISAVYAAAFNGIIFHAVTLTMAVFFMMLFLYRTRIIKVTQKLRSGIIMATGAVFLVYLVAIVLGFFGIQVPFLHEGGPIGILISLVIVGIAAMNLLLDFDNFEKGEQYKAPAYMEWYSAMGLVITLVWLYLEILRLVALTSRD